MSRLLYPQRRDKNERPIITALEHVGAIVTQMDKSAGFDLLVAFCGKFYALEVKQPGEHLTDNERKVAARYAQQKAPYFIVTTIDDGLCAIGAIW